MKNKNKTNNYYSCYGDSDPRCIQEEGFKNEWLNQKPKFEKFSFEYSTVTDSFVVKTDPSMYEVPLTEEEFVYYPGLQVKKQEYFHKRTELEYRPQWEVFQKILKENENKGPFEWDFEWINSNYQDREDGFSLNLLKSYIDSYKGSLEELESRMNGKDRYGQELDYQNYVYFIEERHFQDEFNKIRESVIETNRQMGTVGENIPVWEDWVLEKTGRKCSFSQYLSV